MQLCFLLNKPKSNPPKTKLQSNGSRVVPPAFYFSFHAGSDSAPPGWRLSSGFSRTDHPHSWMPFTLLILFLPQETED